MDNQHTKSHTLGVYLQIVFTLVALATELAVVFFVGMDGVHVGFEARHEGKRFLADGANEGPVTPVNGVMVFQARQTHEQLATLLTLVLLEIEIINLITCPCWAKVFSNVAYAKDLTKDQE